MQAAQNKNQAAPTFVYLDPVNRRFPVAIYPNDIVDEVLAIRRSHYAVHLAAIQRACGEL
jgi:hypothetical protein